MPNSNPDLFPTSKDESLDFYFHILIYKIEWGSIAMASLGPDSLILF